MTTKEILTQAVTAKNAINSADTETKNKALANMADALLAHTDAILEANKQDVEAARGKISDVMIDRLMLDAGRIEGMAKGIRELIDLDDPAGKVLRTVERQNGIVIEKTAVPMGVIAIIYESRPNVTSDAAALCIKSGNVCVLRSGKEAWKSANAVVTALKEGMVKANLPGEGIQLIEDTSRESSVELMKAVGYVDLLIPRGGPGLIRSCVENAKVPCIQTGTGICHVYVDESASFEKALQIIENAKTSRPSVCNAEEVLLVHSAVAEKFLPLLQKKLVEERKIKGEIPVELRLCEKAAKIISGTPAGPAASAPQRGYGPSEDQTPSLRPRVPWRRIRANPRAGNHPTESCRNAASPGMSPSPGRSHPTRQALRRRPTASSRPLYARHWLTPCRAGSSRGERQDAAAGPYRAAGPAADRGSAGRLQNGPRPRHSVSRSNCAPSRTPSRSAFQEPIYQATHDPCFQGFPKRKGVPTASCRAVFREV